MTDAQKAALSRYETAFKALARSYSNDKGVETRFYEAGRACQILGVPGFPRLRAKYRPA